MPSTVPSHSTVSDKSKWQRVALFALGKCKHLPQNDQVLSYTTAFPDTTARYDETQRDGHMVKGRQHHVANIGDFSFTF